MYQPTLESDGAWGIQSQHLPNDTNVMKSHSLKYLVAHTCEWVLPRNMCKHQIVVILTCTNIIHETIMHYYGRWYGSHHGGLGHMFVDPRHIPDDMECNDDDKYEHLESDDGFMEFNGLMTMEQNDHPMGGIIGSNETINSSTPIERVFGQLVVTMQKITNECRKGDLTLCEHATSHMKILG